MPKTWSEGGLTAAQIARIETEFRVPVDDLFGPTRSSWILALARESLLPDDVALRALRDAIEWQVAASLKPQYARPILAGPLAADGGWNTMTFYLDEDGWHGRRSTWREGFPCWPAIGMVGRGPGGTLTEVLEHILVGADGTRSAEWQARRQARPDLYGPR